MLPMAFQTLSKNRFCISEECQNQNKIRFCLCRFLDLDTRNISSSWIICDECYKIIYREHKFNRVEEELKGFKYQTSVDYFGSYLKFCVHIMLISIKSSLENNRCPCNLPECNYKCLTEEEKDLIDQKFISIYKNFAPQLRKVW